MKNIIAIALSGLVFSYCSSSKKATELKSEQVEEAIENAGPKNPEKVDEILEKNNPKNPEQVDKIIGERKPVKTEEKKSGPDWHNNPPKADSLYGYAIGTGESRNQMIAKQKARLNAEINMSKSVSLVVEESYKEYVQKNGNDEENQSFTRVKSSFSAIKARGVKTHKIDFSMNGDQYVAYILLRFDKKLIEEDVQRIMMMQNEN